MKIFFIEEKDRYVFIIISLIALIGCQYFFSKYILFVLLVIIFIVYRLLPRWVNHLTWKEIKTAVSNQSIYGSDGSLVIFKIKNKKIFVYKDNDFHGLRMAVKVPLKHWNNTITKKELENLIQIYGGWCGYTKTIRNDFFVIFPEDPINGCVDILKYIINEKCDGLNSGIMARIDYTNRNIWEVQP